ncbi:hypothetical protein QTN47_11305 [Danxiaibacter flavus]|uniref:Uncharacterized protein n=1 Tax=Danxiaibacter flavus TaxID=3049108 RepID=A0ABV3ZDY9_9BACT|nr:hypothetical protein QNM32_11310 [Chitinophagaceae bacterium DXS]
MRQTREDILLEQERLIRLRPMVESQLKQLANVDHVGVGVKEINNELSDDLCFRVYVREKKAKQSLQPSDIIPTEIFGAKTDVIRRSEILDISDRGRHRPLRGGIQLRTERVDGSRPRLAGTIGALVTSISSSSGKLMALTCQHVVSEGVFAPANPNAVIGMKVGQPTYSTCCCCVCGDIGTVFKVQKDANVDCALIDLKQNLIDDISSSSMQNFIEGIGGVNGVAQAVCFEHVKKRGAATELTEGIVVEVVFDGSQILVRPDAGANVFADFGDSGAVLLNAANKVIGLIWAANRNVMDFPNSSSSGTFFRKEGVANHIGAVMGALGITIAGQNSSGLAIPSANCAPEVPQSSSSRLSSSSVSGASSGSGLSSSSDSSALSSSSSSSLSSSSSSSSASCTATAIYRHAGAIKTVANLIACKATIQRHPMTLACEPNATFSTFSTVWTGITKNDISKWAQMGLTRRRSAGSAAISEYIKCETKAGPAAADYDNTITPPAGFPAFPAVGTTHDFECALDQATGRWDYSYDGAVIHHFTNAGWAFDVGQRVDYTGEVFGSPDSRMAGSSANKCSFTNCMYKVVTYNSSSSSGSSGRSSSSSSSRPVGTPGPYVAAGLAAGNIDIDDATADAVDLVSGSAIDIWDKNA